MKRVEEKEEQKKGSFLERKERVTEGNKSNELLVKTIIYDYID